MSTPGSSMRTPLGRVRGLGSAKSGTEHFWRIRVSSVALIPLTIGFVIVLLSLMGKSHAAVDATIGSPLVAILLILFIVASLDHMRLGMQVIIEDYVHAELPKVALVMLNTGFTAVVGLAAIFAILKISFGV